MISLPRFRDDDLGLEEAIRAPGEIGNIICIEVSNEEYVALSKHPAYDCQPDEDRADREAQSLAQPPLRVLIIQKPRRLHLRGRLERRGQNIVLISASIAPFLIKGMLKFMPRLKSYSGLRESMCAIVIPKPPTTCGQRAWSRSYGTGDDGSISSWLVAAVRLCHRNRSASKGRCHCVYRGGLG